MEILRSIQLYAEARGMPFLVIGGHAVNAYGLLRSGQTGLTREELLPLCMRYADRHLYDRLKEALDT